MTLEEQSQTSPVLLKCDHVVGQYRGIFGIVQPVNGISLTVNSGDIIGIVGESGCGKSTFGELITGTPRDILCCVSGSIKILDYDMYRSDPELIRTQVKAKIMAFVPQSSLESLNPVKRIRDFILDVVKQRTGHIGNKNEVLMMARKHFERLGLDGSIIDRYPHELSGGMRQRAVVAISTLFNPKLLIIDEPTSALDVTSQKILIKMLYEMYQAKIIESILFISHDIATLRQLCTKVVVMYAGEIVEEGSMNDIISSPNHPYTQALISSLVSFHHDEKKEKLYSIPGAPPDLSCPPEGCRFGPRCPKVKDICKKEPPPYFKLGKDKAARCRIYEGMEIKNDNE